MQLTQSQLLNIKHDKFHC